MMRINIETLRRALRSPFQRRVALASGLVMGGAVGLVALESQSDSLPLPTKAACCTSALSVGEAKVSPPDGADKDFFEVKGTPAAVMFLVGNNESMQDYPQYLPEVYDTSAPPPPPAKNPGDLGGDGVSGHMLRTGCTDPKLVEAMSWFKKDSTEPTLNGKNVYDTEGLNSPFFDPTKFYHSRGRRIGWQVKEAPYSLTVSFKQLDPTSDIETACWQVLGWENVYSGSAVLNECKACLTSVGWWRGPIVSAKTTGTMNSPSRGWYEPPLPAEANRKWILKGGALNLRPPKFVITRKVIKDIISSKQPVRVGLATFGKDHGWYDPPEILARLHPNCSKAAPDFELTDSDTATLKTAINNLEYRHDERAIGEALFGLGGYFSSTKRQTAFNTWESWFKQSINPGYGWPGCCNGGTEDNPNTGQEGFAYGSAKDEWLKEPQVYNGVWLPGQPWEPWDANEKLVCSECQVNSVIVIADGAPKYDNTVPITKMMEILTKNKARHVTDGSLVQFNSLNPKTSPDVGGINYCDQFPIPGDPEGKLYPKTVCDYGYESWNWPTGLGVGNKNFMDDVAFFLANTDLREDMPGKQTIRTFTIGFGERRDAAGKLIEDTGVMLQSIALAGNGKFFRADNTDDLKGRINEVLGEIRQLSTSFATANIASVQTGGQSSVYVPRFVPRMGRPYEGHLFRFFFFSEFAQGCDVAKKKDGKIPFDLNEDGDCEDSFYVDKPTKLKGLVPQASDFSINNIVQENTDGIWVKVTTATKLEDGRVEKGSAAIPFWDLGETLGARKAAAKCDLSNPLGATSGRCIFTVVDRNNDGKFTEADNPPVEFHTDNKALLKPALLAGGDDFCAPLLNSIGEDASSTTLTDAQRDQCVQVLINHVRGLDYAGKELTGTGSVFKYKERPCADDKTGKKSCKLADIFHSTPVTVEPPVEPFLCNLGLSSQCVSTLYDDFSSSVSSEALCGAGGGGKSCYARTPLEKDTDSSGAEYRYGSYDRYRKERQKRERIVLVGSNAGMLHAIHVGSALPDSADENGNGKPDWQEKGVLDDLHDIGTGQEMWAFIPPDLTAKLSLQLGASRNHHYFVDGTAMVRDIWADGVNKADGKKQWDEFRTVAVVGERSGGDRYTALDVTDPRLMLEAVRNPSGGHKPFRWMFPNACDPESLSVGQSWSNFAPKPPPIGPVRIKSTDASNARGWDERWVAVLNGGYSPDLSRGRGVYMVDAWTGNKVWSAEARPGAGGSDYQTVLNQMMPVVAAPALIDVGEAKGVQRDLDGFFDTMIVGDMGGQVWTFRMHEPGVIDSGTGTVNNWFGARSLEVQRQDGSAFGSPNAFEKAPFFHMASTVLQPDTGWLRSFLGTGDRQHMRAMPSTGCSPQNLVACLRLKCNVDETFVSKVNGQERTTEIKYVAGVLQVNKETWKSDSAVEACSNTSRTLTNLTISCPNATSPGSGSYPVGSSDKTSFSAGTSCSVKSGVWSCTSSTLPSFKSDLKLNTEEQWTVGGNSYFGFHAYGGAKRTFKDAISAVAFDKTRVTDKQGVMCEGINCSLVDVTIPKELYKTFKDAAGVEQRYLSAADLPKLKSAGSESAGWFMTYDNKATERTASGSTVLAGVVFWSSFAPADGAGAAACSLSGPGDMSYAWQADAITGLPDQAAGFRLDLGAGGTGWIRGRGRPTTAPPGEPAPIVALSKTGGIRYEVALSAPGMAVETEKLGSQKNVTPDISWLEVPRNLHECRHENSEACSE
ncbi:hypothetical protein [Melittangium boletus]|uniref:hypothetical protein n=1 Tax=Melittangium boletus TaxID=83453 RepID=UPI003DA25A25